jgi:hypothetical protein
MKRKAGKAVAFVLFMLVIIPLTGYVTMHLWNWLMPHLFSLPLITFWESLGLILLGKILFGGIRGWRPGSRMRGNWINKWDQLTPEEREKFAHAMRRKCGTWEPPAPAAPTSTPNA